jgi:hypothetical protein
MVRLASRTFLSVASILLAPHLLAISFGKHALEPSLDRSARQNKKGIAERPEKGHLALPS